MIRVAVVEDVPAIVGMVAKLHAATGIVLPFEPQVATRFLLGLLPSPLGCLWVSQGPDGPCGFLAASVGAASISMRLVAMEHGWWAEQGGLQLLRAYLGWAKEQGCFAARMSTPPGNERAAMILQRMGFDLAEQAWVKVI